MVLVKKMEMATTKKDNQNQANMPIKSPYNFVPAPAEDQLFKPEWADQVSHDIPFSNGESGEMEVEITAETPIFVRNGHCKPNEGEKPTSEFSHYIDAEGNIQYFIPATSIKGMIRNVMEILSFSRMDPKLVNNDRYSHRDLTDGSLYRNIYDTNKVECGWLYEGENGDWEIDRRGKPYRISFEEIDRLCGTNFRNELKEIRIKKSECEEIYHDGKLDKIKKENKTYYVKDFNFRNNEYISKIPSKHKNAKGKYLELKNKKGTIYVGISTEEIQGTLVFTGSPSYEKQKEFVFPNFSIGVIKLSNDDKISKIKQKEFLFTYKDHDKDNISVDWKYWREILEKPHGRIPIFFTEEKGEVKHFGLAYMYKLPYNKSIHETKTMNSKKNGPNFVETLFGYTNDNSLKGRIFIQNAKTIDSPNIHSLKKEILSSPKASFLPFYVKQNESMNGDYKYISYNDDLELAGYKRYITHPSSKDFSLTSQGVYSDIQLKNQKVFTSFKPIDKGTKFKFKLRYHNLNAIEIGSLISSLTFHGSNKNTFHSIGAAKPFGFGKISIKIASIESINSNGKSENEYLLEFENYMKSKVPNWLDSPQLLSLFAYAKGKTSNLLTYPTIKEFIELKNDKINKLYLKADYLNTTIQAVSEKVKPQEKLELNQIKYSILSKDLNLMLNTNIIEFNAENIQIIAKKISELFQSDNDCKNKLLKGRESYEWKTNISKWLGNDVAQALYDNLKLNNK